MLGNQCSYQNDSWDEQYAYMAIACPGLEVTWLSIRFTTLVEGQTAIDIFGAMPPDSYSAIELGVNLSHYENISISAKAENSSFSYFVAYETERFLLSAEVFFPEDAAMTLEEVYIARADIVLYIALESMLDIVSFNNKTAYTA